MDAAHCYIATAWYAGGSLRAWREALGADALAARLPLLLAVAAQVAEGVCALHEAGVVHYDLKCDNVLCQPRGCYGRESGRGNGTGGRGAEAGEAGEEDPGFDAVLCDFGESKAYGAGEDGHTTRNRGTEFMKSPEMLTVANASAKDRATFDRRKQAGAGRASDVWGFGCLLYELLTGLVLFHDDDWIRFFIRVTSAAAPEELLPPQRLAPLLAAPGGALVVDLLRAIFIRDPVRRPCRTPPPSY